MAYNANLYMPYGQAYGQQSYPMPTTAQYAQPVNGLVGVTGIEGARAYQMPPNSRMPLFDNDADILYLKTTDAAGYPTIKMFSFAPMETPAGAAETAPEARYATKADIESLREEIAALRQPETAKARSTARKAAGDG